MESELYKLFKEAEKVIRESRHIVIAGHTSPDGDSIGSILALYSAIKDNIGKETFPYLAEDIPPSLKFLSNGEEFSSVLEQEPDLVIGVDYGDFKRLNLPEDKIKNAKVLTFDHHPKTRQKGDIQIIDTGFSSTTELIYEFFKSIGWNVSTQTAIYISTGILTDTGAFAHQTSPRMFRFMGELMQKGVPLKDIYTHTFSDKPKNVLNTWGKCLQHIETNDEYGFVSIYVPFEKFQEYGIVSDDLDGLKAILNMVQGSRFSVLAIEYERGKIKGSFRSDRFKDVDVSKIAEKLGGGGHKYAAGFSFSAKDINEARDIINKAVESTLKVENSVS